MSKSRDKNQNKNKTQDKNVPNTAASVAGDVLGTVAKVATTRNPVAQVAHVAKGVTDVVKDLTRNHPDWYTKYPLADLFKVSFTHRLEVEDSFKTSHVSKGTIHAEDWLKRVPAVARIQMELTIPKVPNQDVFMDSIDLIYNSLRSANSGRINYKPGDLAQYVLNVRLLHALVNSLNRAVAIFNNANAYTKNSPRSLVNACGLNYGDLQQNIANARLYLSTKAIMIAKQYPLKCALLDRTAWLFSNIFKDDDGIKKQVYVPTLGMQQGYFKVETDGSVVGASLVISAQNYATYAEYVSAIETLISATSQLPFAQVIAGDIIKAFGEASYFTIKVSGENECVPEVYDVYALTQLSNATICAAPGLMTTEGSSIYRVTADGIPYSPLAAAVGKIPTQYTSECNIVNSPSNNPTSGELLSAMQLAFTCDSPVKVNDVWYSPFTSVGSEVVEVILIERGDESHHRIYNGVDLAADSLTEAITVSCWAQFDWFPALFVGYLGSTGNFTGDIMMDVRNFAYLSDQQVAEIHMISTLSEMKVGDNKVSTKTTQLKALK